MIHSVTLLGTDTIETSHRSRNVRRSSTISQSYARSPLSFDVLKVN